MLIIRSPKWALLSLAVSLAIFLIIYFTVIQPDNNAANNAITQGEKQLQQSVNAAGSGVPAGATNLVNCLAAAGSDTGKIQACQAKFQP